MTHDIDTVTKHIRIARLLSGMLLGVLLGIGVLFAGVIDARPAAAQEAQVPWFERAEIVGQLAARYTEAPTALGLTSTGAVLELFTAADGATWTLVITRPNGMSRVIATGESWTKRPQLVRGRVS